MLSSVNNFVSSQAQNMVMASKSNGNKDFATQFASALKGEDSKKLYQACQELESVFVNTVIKTMRQSIQKSGLMGASFAEETYQSMLDEEYSKQISKTKTLGIADIMYKQLSQNISQKANEIRNNLTGQTSSSRPVTSARENTPSDYETTTVSTTSTKSDTVKNTASVYELSVTTAATQSGGSDEMDADNLEGSTYRQLYEPRLSDYNGNWEAFEEANNKYRMSLLDPNNLPGWLNSEGNKYTPIHIQNNPKLLGTNSKDYLSTDYIVDALGNIDRIDHTYSGDVRTFIPNLGGWKMTGATVPGLGAVYTRQTSAYRFETRYTSSESKPTWYDETAQSNWIKTALANANNGGAKTAQNSGTTTDSSTGYTNNNSSSYDPDYSDGWAS